MYRGQAIGVIVPAYNEEGLVGDVLQSMPKFVDTIYAIDDASADGTWAEIREAAPETAVGDVVAPTPSAPQFDRAQSSDLANDGGSLLHERAHVHERIGRVKPIQHLENRGAGGAIKTGYLAALEDDVDITVTVDGDGQMDLGVMPDLLDPIVDDRADYAKGNRLLYEEYREEMPRFRLFGNSILTFLTKISSGYWKTMDPQNGYTAISRTALERIDVQSLFEYYGYCNEILARLNLRGMRVADVALPARYGDEQSHISYGSYIWNVSGMLLRNFTRRLRSKYLVLDFHPLAMFYLFGVATLAGGAMGIGWSVYRTLAGSASIFVGVMLSLLVLALGGLFVLTGMLLDMQVNEHNEVQIHE